VPISSIEDAEGAHDVSVVIVNYRTPTQALACLRSVAESRAVFAGLKVVLVDGGSGDGSAALLAEAVAGEEFAGWVSFLPLAINGGFGWANNQAILRELQGAAPPTYIHLLNPDAVVDPDAIRALRDHMVAQPDCGAVGSRIVSPGGETEISAFRFPTVASEFVASAQTPGLARFVGAHGPLASGASRPFEADWVTGASVMLRSETLRAAGLFDDGFFLYFEEVELMSRIKRAGWSVWHEPASVVVHEGGAATNVRWDVAARRPSYWYRSKRRLLVRLFGKRKAAAAFLAWGAGRLLWSVRKRVQPAVRVREVEHETRDMLSAWMASLRFDGEAAVPDWRSAPDMPPAWMRRPQG